MRLSLLTSTILSTLLLWTSLILAHPQPAATPAELQKRGERKGDHKYLHEPGGDDILGHYDTRYFHGVVSYEERTDTLTHMIRAYLNTFRELGLETWIAHGTLLGWWWNGKVRDITTAFSRTCLLTYTILDPPMGLGSRHPSLRRHPSIHDETPQSFFAQIRL